MARALYSTYPNIARIQLCTDSHLRCTHFLTSVIFSVKENGGWTDVTSPMLPFTCLWNRSLFGHILSFPWSISNPTDSKQEPKKKKYLGMIGPSYNPHLSIPICKKRGGKKAVYPKLSFSAFAAELYCTHPLTVDSCLPGHPLKRKG